MWLWILISFGTIAWIVVLAAVIRFFHIFTSAAVPEITLLEQSKNTTMKNLIDGIDMLKKPYHPPRLWGRSGHAQTFASDLIIHPLHQRAPERRVNVQLNDGTTVTIDVFEPLNMCKSYLDVTLVLIPGIPPSCESNYIRSCVYHVQDQGYRCVLLNHLGDLRNVKLTSNRIFSYGSTDELHAVINQLFLDYPFSQFITVGFSMGGNINTRFFMEVTEKQRCRILLGLNICQGCSHISCGHLYDEWENARCVYNFFLTVKVKRLLRHHYEQVVAPHVASGLIDEKRLWSTTSIATMDEIYTCRAAGFRNRDEYYTACESLPHLHKIRMPMIFLFAKDDPIIPKCLWEPVKEFASTTEDMAFIMTNHGGHLAFIEGGFFLPNPVSWVNRFIVAVADQAVKNYAQ